jgi:uncharacterized protein (DUF169 family)
MLNTIDCNKYGKELMDKLMLRFSPIAFKLIFNESEIPENSMRPVQKTGDRLAMCQAFSLVRRNRSEVTMLNDDHWCLWPLVCFKTCPIDEDDYKTLGSVQFMKDPEKGIQAFRENFPWLDCACPPLGFTLAPLDSCEFVPDVVVIYCRASQLRSLVMAAKFQEGELFNVVPDAIASCCYATIPLLNGQKYNITLPDPGEFERGLADEDEIIFSLRGERLGDLLGGLSGLEERGFSYRNLKFDMNFNYPRPQFYDDMFAKWGLATGKTWVPGSR